MLVDASSQSSWRKDQGVEIWGGGGHDLQYTTVVEDDEQEEQGGARRSRNVNFLITVVFLLSHMHASLCRPIRVEKHIEWQSAPTNRQG